MQKKRGIVQMWGALSRKRGHLRKDVTHLVAGLGVAGAQHSQQLQDLHHHIPQRLNTGLRQTEVASGYAWRLLRRHKGCWNKADRVAGTGRAP